MNFSPDSQEDIHQLDLDEKRLAVWMYWTAAAVVLTLVLVPPALLVWVFIVLVYMWRNKR